ncbi:hypothetical protein MO973_11590 [Paenibacillus sp. TRM 82003]|nr:hypothetical protein [Paenibacillus sp. TRM 82003]
MALILLGWMCARRKSWKPFLLMLSLSGMIYVFEFVIFVLWNSYEYHPNVLKIDYFDNVLGAVISNALAVPAVATFISLYLVRWPWITAAAVGFGAIDLLFFQLGIYEHHWWRSYYTTAALLLFFPFVQFWNKRLLHEKRWAQGTTLLMFAWSWIGTATYILQIIQIHQIRIDYFDNVFRDEIFTGAIYSMLKALLVTGFIFFGGAWRSWIGALLGLIAMDTALMSAEIIRMNVPTWQYLLILLPCCGLFILVANAAKHALERW